MNATGQRFQSKGHFEVAFTSENHHKRNVTYLDTPVSMPIISSNRWNVDGTRGILEEHAGGVEHVPPGQTDPLLVRNKVYFMNMHVRKKFLAKPDQGCGRQAQG